MTDKPVDTQPQNTVDAAATSIKQTVEAKSNSSVSGVVQAQSIINSTINIQVNNSVDKDELSSKNNQNKKLHNSPKQTRFFTGRENELNQVDELFKSNKEVAISGMGGVGKTQTALEFCHLHINDYQTILWVNAETEGSFNRSYYGVVDLLNLVSGSSTNDAASSAATNDGASNQGLKVDEVISLVKRWLANNPNWLMVLDNLEDPKLINNYLPSNHQGHILITTRSSPIDHAAIVPLNKMNLETASLFLLKRVYPDKVVVNAQSLQEINIDSSLLANAQQLAKAIDGLPLALKQAAAFIYETKCSLLDYLAFYQQALADKTAKNLDDHDSVFITFNLAFDKVRKESVTAAKLLEVCSFLDSEIIPEEIFTSAGKFLGDELAKLQDNTYEFNNCLKLLLGYSLIERDTNNKSLSIHRLVQTVIRELLTEDNKKLCVDSLAKAFWSLSREDSNNPNTWPYYQKLLPSVTSLFEFAKLYQSNIIEVAYLFQQFGLYCDTQALFAQSLTFYNQALVIYTCDFDTNQTNISTVFHNIGIIYESQDKHIEALFYLNKSLSISKNLCGDNSIAYASTLASIAITYQKQGEYTESLNLHKEALSIFKHHFNPHNPNIAKSFDNIASIYKAQGNYSEALSLYNQAINIYKHLFGNNHPDLAGAFNNVGEVYRQQGNYPAALDYYNQSLTTYKHHFRDNHPDLAITLANIAVLYETTNQQLEATNCYQQALEILDKFLLPNHPHIKHLLTQYSQLLLKLNKPNKAQPLLDRLASLEQSP